MPQAPSRRRQVLFALLVLIGFLLSGTAGAVAYFLPVLTAIREQTGRKSDIPHAAAASPTPQARSQPVAPFTVLLLGSDDDQKFDPRHVLTQSMILVRVDPGRREVTMLSIPRDLWVPLPNSVRSTGSQPYEVGGYAKIDLAYAYSGPSSALATVEQDLGVHVDDYIWIGLKGLIQLIDLVGGIDVMASNPVVDDYYPNDVNSRDPYGYSRVAVLPGPQHLDGEHAMQYVRSRHGDLRGDFGRSVRQQQVLLALRLKAKQLNVGDIPQITSAFSGEFKTSMGLDRIRQLLELAASLNPSQIRQIVLIGAYTSNGVIAGQDVLLPNWALILPVVHQYFP